MCLSAPPAAHRASNSSRLTAAESAPPRCSLSASDSAMRDCSASAAAMLPEGSCGKGGRLKACAKRQSMVLGQRMNPPTRARELSFLAKSYSSLVVLNT
eukprot:138365-Chlamydomonas_euryale.AAC.1